ncbi:hypothetical protein M406DRAFT_329660 [Cryphonectria parasitica EP155]|uniref:Uncharacterized protein n=1 Tax=Cryphonectria parasitica (strain ATCC 38755 / EP155) TaxID=660469 RepID=A0A9P5CP47_CRYP1|nr:uncharacterized protein M406DRAFT_329660 [Cryphonectria parasitica EP155]KAF3765798.1 hypothetical protein M406DRAFT_329660 [Cryphonectria parasitica EP155]
MTLVRVTQEGAPYFQSLLSGAGSWFRAILAAPSAAAADGMREIQTPARLIAPPLLPPYHQNKESSMWSRSSWTSLFLVRLWRVGEIAIDKIRFISACSDGCWAPNIIPHVCSTPPLSRWLPTLQTKKIVQRPMWLDPGQQTQAGWPDAERQRQTAPAL